MFRGARVLAAQTMRIPQRMDLDAINDQRVVLITAASLAACNQKAEAPAAPRGCFEADAAAAADATRGLGSRWTAKIEAPYAKDVVAFDPVAAPMSTDGDNWHKLSKASLRRVRQDRYRPQIQLLDSIRLLHPALAP